MKTTFIFMKKAVVYILVLTIAFPIVPLSSSKALAQMAPFIPYSGPTARRLSEEERRERDARRERIRFRRIEQFQFEQYMEYAFDENIWNNLRLELERRHNGHNFDVGFDYSLEYEKPKNIYILYFVGIIGVVIVVLTLPAQVVAALAAVVSVIGGYFFVIDRVVNAAKNHANPGDTRVFHYEAYNRNVVIEDECLIGTAYSGGRNYFGISYLIYRCKYYPDMRVEGYVEFPTPMPRNVHRFLD